MTYSSLQEIKNDFQITADDTTAIIENLKSIRNETHPDRNHGDFVDESIKERHIKANNAIEYIEKMSTGGQLIVMEQVTALVKQVIELIPNQNQQNMQDRLETRIDYQVSHFRSPMTLPKFSLTGLTAFFSFIVLFPKQAEENPVFKGVLNFDSKGLVIPWLIILCITAFFWVYAYILDERNKRLLERFKLESFQNGIFADYIRHNKQIAKDDLAIFIMRDHRPRGMAMSFTRLLGGGIPLDVAQALADAIISRAERNKVITKTNTPSLSEIYVLNNSEKFNSQET